MARKPSKLRQERPQSRISILLDADVHRRLRALSVVRGATIQAIVEELVEGAVAAVRLPFVGGTASTDDAA